MMKGSAGCGKSPPAAFSRRSDAHRTARVRFASSLVAALLDGLFAHPGGDSDTTTTRELNAAYYATIEFRSLLEGRSRDGRCCAELKELSSQRRG
jgi:hypothetical protein